MSIWPFIFEQLVLNKQANFLFIKAPLPPEWLFLGSPMLTPANSMQVSIIQFNTATGSNQAGEATHQDMLASPIHPRLLGQGLN